MRAELALKKAEFFQEQLVKFLRDIVALPSESCHEDKVAIRILKEMDELGYDQAFIDSMGNVIGRIGHGSRALVFDSHIDTVGIGDPAKWEHDPYRGKYEHGIVYGRGASDNKGGLASMVYGGKLMKEIGIPEEWSVYVVGTVQEEDCDGLALGYLLEHSIPRAEAVVLGECTGLQVYRGHRGRMEMQLTTPGVACHASAPQRGVNAVYKMAPIISAIEKLNEQLADDPFLGRGTIAVTKIDCRTGSLNTVPDACTIYMDRRLTWGETRDSSLAEVQKAAGAGPFEAIVLEYDTPSYTGFQLKQEKYFPTWTLPEEHQLVQAGLRTRALLLPGQAPAGKWIFSTNGVASMGRLGIPTIGFGPGVEEHAHSTADQISAADLVYSAAFYSLLPCVMLEQR